MVDIRSRLYSTPARNETPLLATLRSAASDESPSSSIARRSRSNSSVFLNAAEIMAASGSNLSCCATAFGSKQKNLVHLLTLNMQPALIALDALDALDQAA